MRLASHNLNRSHRVCIWAPDTALTVHLAVSNMEDSPNDPIQVDSGDGSQRHVKTPVGLELACHLDGLTGLGESRWPPRGNQPGESVGPPAKTCSPAAIRAIPISSASAMWPRLRHVQLHGMPRRLRL
jgi:hypothetical protein